MIAKEETNKNHWHLIFGTALQQLLTPVNIDVQLEVKVMKEPPRADVLLIRRDTPTWTPQQYALLPDGIRDTHASHIMLEFKYTQSVDTDGILQTINNQRLYLQTHPDIEPNDFKCFLVSARQPQAETLKKYAFKEFKTGIYPSANPLITPLTLISINELANTKHNAFIRCFSSQKKHQKEAFALLDFVALRNFSEPLYWIMLNLFNVLFGEDKMDTDKSQSDDIPNIPFNPEVLMRLGKALEEACFAGIPIETRLKGLGVEERLQGLGVEERLQGLVQGLDAETVLKHYEPEERLQGLAPEERLQGLSPEQIEAYLQKIKSH